jgi:hypothetical protein
MAYIAFYMRVLMAAIVPEFISARTSDFKPRKSQSRLALKRIFVETKIGPILVQMITILINIQPKSAYTCAIQSANTF